MVVCVPVTPNRQIGRWDRATYDLVDLGLGDAIADIAGPLGRATERLESTVHAVGPVPMMHAVAELTRPSGVRTIVSLNSITIDGSGKGGGCRMSVGGVTKSACVDGPESDGHLVDFRELADRLTTYRTFEQEALARRQARQAGVARQASPLAAATSR